jgi:hypothetical protein
MWGNGIHNMIYRKRFIIGTVDSETPINNAFRRIIKPVFRIRIHLIRIRSSILDSKPIRIQGFKDQKFKKKLTAKKITFFFKN